jgi:hypothetical protein
MAPIRSSGRRKRAALNEIRVNRLLAAVPPPVPVPRLVAASARARSITVGAIDGDPLGPKFPLHLHDGDVADLLALVEALGHYRPRRRWFRRLELAGRLRRHIDEGLLGRDDATAIEDLALGVGWRFAHGDVTARNVLRDRDGHLVLIDWEWAGLYPVGYELAFLWFSLIDVDGARATVVGAVPDTLRRGLLLSATLIQLLHLHLWIGRPEAPFVANHRRTFEDLVDAVRSWPVGPPRHAG